MQIFQSIFTRIIDLLFPQKCAGCGSLGILLCKNCIASLPRATPSVHPFVTALFDYQSTLLRRAIWRFKYKNAQGFAKHFGEQLYEDIIGNLGEELHISKNDSFLLVPIPLHKKRFRERGYNQSELIARAITNHDTDKLFEFSRNTLIRIRETKPQARSDKRATRLENLRGAFHANSDTAKGRNIILIDDVTTTGATFSEARKALRKAGARSVRAYAIAH